MDIIKNNPYRVVGLLIGATAAEQRKQMTRLQRFLEADQEPDADFSFPALGKIHRTLEMVEAASSKLNLDSDKINAALFWFYNGNPITDEPALEAIKDGDIKIAISIWEKVISDSEVTKRNASAHSNLATLYLNWSSEDANDKIEKFKQGIKLKLKFLDSDFFKDFQKLSTDITFKISKNDLQLSFLTELNSENEKNKLLTTNEFFEIINDCEFSAKEKFQDIFIQKPIQRIERQIEEATSKLNLNNGKGLEIGKALLSKTVDDINLLQTILGKSNIKYASIADKLSSMIVECGVIAFNFYKKANDEIDWAKAIKSEEQYLPFYKIAVTMAVGSKAKEKANTNLESCNKFIEKKVYHTCWFCQKHESDSFFSYSITLYKSVSSTQYKYIEISVPKCEGCNKVHKKYSVISNTCKVIGGLIGGVAGILFIEESFWTLFSSGFGVGVGWIVGELAYKEVAKKTDTRDIEIQKDFPPIKNYLNEYWSFSKPGA